MTLQRQTDKLHAQMTDMWPPNTDHQAVYGDHQRLSDGYAVRFSFKKGSLQVVWDPDMPPNREALQPLAEAYLAARDGFLIYASARTGLDLVALTPAEAMLVSTMHEVGACTPLFTVGVQTPVIDTLNLHRPGITFYRGNNK